ncbi:hypothetical protein [Desulforamulus reducens]|uniref:hypothetical protein n=1 Tax=Desulforamulus reducens TaxID=59610 RepID=UPI000314846C|nr:hypothetical protein [Desulforamulus reducens]
MKLKQIYGYGKTILCHQPTIGDWYNNIECSISKRNIIVTTEINKSDYQSIVSPGEFCSDCPCNKGAVNLFWEMK